MGKRSRRRAGAPTAAPHVGLEPKSAHPDAAEHGRSGVSTEDGPPPPPWAPLPLTEIAVGVGLVMAVGGFVAGGRTGTGILIVGLLLGSVAGFEQSLREHRSGFRSHAAVLAGMPASVLVGVLALLGAPGVVIPPVAVGVLIACYLPLRSDFSRRQADRDL